MQRSWKWATITAAMLATACTPEPAVISEIDDDALKVQFGFGTDPNDILTTAAEGCALYDKQAVRISTECEDASCMRGETLFACR